MQLIEMIKELLMIPNTNLLLNGYDSETIISLRETYRNSLRNTINKEIENSLDHIELKGLIENYGSIIEKALLISLYRRYLWLQPTDTKMYRNLVNVSAEISTTYGKTIEDFIDSGDYDNALKLVECIFLNTLLDQSLVEPIKLRSFVDVVHEYLQLQDDEDSIMSMKQTRAYAMRENFLLTIINNRLEHQTDPLEFRRYFTDDRALYITVHHTIGLRVGKRYFALNPCDREGYAYFCQFLGFWHWNEEKRQLLECLAVNDFDKAALIVRNLPSHALNDIA